MASHVNDTLKYESTQYMHSKLVSNSAKSKPFLWYNLFTTILFFQIPKAGEVNLKNPDDMSFVYSGAYVPLSCKLIEQVSDESLKNVMFLTKLHNWW